MYNIRWTNAAGDELRMGRKQSLIRVISLTGIDGIPVKIVPSQGFDQIGESINNMSISSRSIGLIGRIYNFTGDELHRINYMFLPMSTVRLYFDDKYWIDCAVKETPVFTYDQCVVSFAVSLLAPYPYWLSVRENYYKLGGTSGGFNFPISYNVPHNFGLYADTLFLNCVNNGDTRVDYIAEITVTSGEAVNVTLTNAQNQRYLKVYTSISAQDTVRVFRENNILRVTKTAAGITTDIFSALDVDSTLYDMEVGDNVIRATKDSGDGLLAVAIRFYDTLTAVHYGI